MMGKGGRGKVILDFAPRLRDPACAGDFELALLRS
jgi:hypothetical protein